MSTTALQQQAFALDARYNTLRVTGSPNFRTLYIRRRSQLLRESEKSPEQWRQYLKLRSQLLQQKYGAFKLESSSASNLSRTISKSSVMTETQMHVVFSSTKETLIPTKEAEASRAIVGGTSIAENYAFSGVHHIFDQHSAAVTMVKFANNDKTKICCSSQDGSLSICDVVSEPPTVLAILNGHQDAIPSIDWSANNDLVASVSLDCTLKLWNTHNFTCIRTVKEPNNGQILSCIFQPNNNNLILTGNSRGELRIVNVSTGMFIKSCCKLGGTILALTTDTSGKIVWAGNERGEIVSVLCELNGGLLKARKITIDPHCFVTSLCYRTWISREARNPLLLVNASNNSMCLFSIADSMGGLQLKRKFQNRHKSHVIRSTFCPIMSFRQGACVVTGSEDGSVYFVDVEKIGNKAVVNTLQGHSSAVLSISFNYDESLLATSDMEGLVILWKRHSRSC
ncbi:WD repeat-containing protein 13-like isoform X2 [Anthonomus grandis grandis]|uniref:WD repeat-containing protein 13-like isoform X2 n=1 Tax=Anthonomus grandis grandis TaxID=2921223 RepID=UPI0021655744|nr:WD repeat-containing protein 13-like isoform X2 [Anthonomus grandis grandis]